MTYNKYLYRKLIGENKKINKEQEEGGKISSLPLHCKLKILSFLEKNSSSSSIFEGNLLPFVKFFQNNFQENYLIFFQKNDLKTLEETGFILKDNFLKNYCLNYNHCKLPITSLDKIYLEVLYFYFWIII